LSPEKSIQIQQDIGADIIFALDEFTSPHASHEKIKETIERTERWARRCLKEMERLKDGKIENSKQALFGIVQGGRYEDLRKLSAKQIASLGFDGFGIGGTFIKEDMATAVRWVNEILPKEKPRHLLGIGEPIDLVLAVENGCDTFDCVAPTRMARNGSLYTSKGKINITNAKYTNDFSPIEESCGCYTCKNYTAAYLSHLFRAKEMLAATLATIHNLYFINNLVSNMRQAILEDRFEEFKEKFLREYK
jgi:queuine tRNA-ribosyltransferase